MTRIDDLQRKYPTIPRDVILKCEVMVQGVRDGGDLDKASEWKPASRGAYQSKDYGGTLQEQTANAPWRVKPGHLLRPKDMRFKSGLGAETRLRSTSPYVIREVAEDRFAIYEGEQKVEDVHFLGHVLQRTGPEPVTSKGTPISAVMHTRPSCFQATLTRHCQYFTTGEQCKFCNLNASNEDARSLGIDIPITVNFEELVEAYRLRSAEVRQLEGLLIMGGFAKAEQEAKIYIDVVEKIASAASYKPNLGVETQPMDKRDMQRLKDAGLNFYKLQMEVMNPQLFPDICPGKAKHTPYEGWLEAFHNAVDTFGVGNVGAQLVPGLTLLSPHGHRTWQEARDYHIEANTWLIKSGVLPTFQPMWWAPGSVYSRDPSNLQKFPPAEYHLEVAQAHHEAMSKYGLYPKVNKFICCGMDRVLRSYGGDIGMLAIAGDVGKWMSSVVPDEENWLAKFIASPGSPR